MVATSTNPGKLRFANIESGFAIARGRLNLNVISRRATGRCSRW